MKITAIIASFALSMVMAHEKPPIDRTHNPLIGRWKVIEAPKYPGAKIPQVLHWVFDDSELRIYDGSSGEILSTSSYRVSNSHEPNWLTLPAAPDRAEVRGIYQVDEDRLRVRQGNPGEARPDDFAPKPYIVYDLVLERIAEQGGAGRPATAPESKPEDKEEPKPESKPAPK